MEGGALNSRQEDPDLSSSLGWFVTLVPRDPKPFSGFWGHQAHM